MVGSSDISPPVVLVVEDEPILRMNAAEILQDHGFAAIEACDAAEALKLIEGRPDIRVLFTDVNMPGDADGLDLAREVHERWPHVLLLVTSGHELLTAADVPDDGDFVPKPYAADELLTRVRGLFDKARPGRES